ncbi:MAG: hypothetical protein OXH15_11390 [Gammaproteobacteria bacterium]|nr:hypothetical protein [Gammaproteobacteria bacterium]
MPEARMPTTLPSPVDRGAFRFVAVDAAGDEWHWVDEELVWKRVAAGTTADGRQGGEREVLH